MEVITKTLYDNYNDHNYANWTVKNYQQPTIQYTFNEDKHLVELKTYIDSTYSQHYSGKDGEKTQVTKLIMDHATSPDFFTGNIIKYAARYGKKDGYNKKDLLKILHYGIMLLEYHDTKTKDK